MSAASFWTPDACIQAIQAWAAEHGRVPTDNGDWRCGGYGHPSGKTVARLFGSWNNGLRAAGLQPRRPGREGYWTKDRIATAMLDWLLVHGRWPEMKDWNGRDPEGKRPAQLTVRRVCGSWRAAKRAAGWAAECRQCGKPFGTDARSTQIWCSSRCRHLAERGVPAHGAEPKCAECGTDLENNVIGCHTCSTRVDNRARRLRAVAAKNGAALSVVEPLPGSDATAGGGLARAVPLTTTENTAAAAA